MNAVDTVYAMTVHKSQGSEFDRVTLLMPPATSRLATRELLYTATTQWLGFHKYGDEGKVMGLAPYGQPRYLPAFRQMLHLLPDGTFALAPEFFRHVENPSFSRHFRALVERTLRELPVGDVPGPNRGGCGWPS